MARVNLRPSEQHSFNSATKEHVFRSSPAQVFWCGVALLTASVAVFVIVALGFAGLVSRDPGLGEPIELLAPALHAAH